MKAQINQLINPRPIDDDPRSLVVSSPAQVALSRSETANPPVIMIPTKVENPSITVNTGGRTVPNGGNGSSGDGGDGNGHEEFRDPADPSGSGNPGGGDGNDDPGDDGDGSGDPEEGGATIKRMRNKVTKIFRRNHLLGSRRLCLLELVLRPTLFTLRRRPFLSEKKRMK